MQATCSYKSNPKFHAGAGATSGISAYASGLTFFFYILSKLLPCSRRRIGRKRISFASGP